MVATRRSRRRRRPRRVPVRLVMFTERCRDGEIDGVLLGQGGKELAHCLGTDREEVIRKLKMRALFACLAHDWEPDVVDDGEL